MVVRKIRKRSRRNKSAGGWGRQKRRRMKRVK